MTTSPGAARAATALRGSAFFGIAADASPAVARRTTARMAFTILLYRGPGGGVDFGRGVLCVRGYGVGGGLVAPGVRVVPGGFCEVVGGWFEGGRVGGRRGPVLNPPPKISMAMFGPLVLGGGGGGGCCAAARMRGRLGRGLKSVMSGWFRITSFRSI